METIKELEQSEGGGWEARFWHVGEPKVSGAHSVLLAPCPRGLERKKREYKNDKHKQAIGEIGCVPTGLSWCNQRDTHTH